MKYRPFEYQDIYDSYDMEGESGFERWRTEAINDYEAGLIADQS